MHEEHYLEVTTDFYREAALAPNVGLCCSTTPMWQLPDQLIYIESVEVCAVKDPMPVDGPCVFSGNTAIYYGNDDAFDDNNGHLLGKNRPLSVCDKTTAALGNLGRDDIFISPSTYFYDGGGCC
jgi:hypothetical protein